MNRLILAYLIFATVALAQAPKPERIITCGGTFSMDRDFELVTALLNTGWTVKHVTALGSNAAVVVLSPPSAEWEAYALEQAKQKREAAAAAREQRAKATAVEKGKP